jgi:hypothetical protein
MLSMNARLQKEFESLGFPNTAEMILLPRVNDVFQFYKLSEKIGSSIGWGLDSLIWTFATVDPKATTPMIEFVTVTLQKNIPRDIGIKVSIERNWRNTAWANQPTTLPNKIQMIKELYDKEALVIDRCNQFMKAREVANLAVDCKKHDQCTGKAKRP